MGTKVCPSLLHNPGRAAQTPRATWCPLGLSWSPGLISFHPPETAPRVGSPGCQALGPQQTLKAEERLPRAWPLGHTHSASTVAASRERHQDWHLAHGHFNSKLNGWAEVHTSGKSGGAAQNPTHTSGSPSGSKPHLGEKGNKIWEESQPVVSAY